MVIKPAYRNASFFSGNHAIAETAGKDARKVVIDKNGNVVFHNPERRAISLLPCGKYLVVKHKDSSGNKYLLCTSNGRLLHKLSGDDLTMEFVADSILFYKEYKEDTGFDYKVLDLSGQRQVPSPFEKTRYYKLSDSVIVATDLRTLSDYRLIVLQNRSFVQHQGFNDYQITGIVQTFLIVRDKKGRFGIADASGKIIVSPLYRQISAETPEEFYRVNPAGYFWNTCLVCSDPSTVRYVIKGNTLEKMEEEITPDPPYKLEYSAEHSAYKLLMRTGRSTDAVFSKYVFYHGPAAYIMAEYQLDKSKKTPKSYRLIDTAGQTMLDSFHGAYCGKGFYIIKGRNGRWAFWKNGKFLSAFVFNSSVYNPSSFTLVPPVNKVVEGGLITVVMNQGNNAFGLIGEDGREILPPIFHYIKPLGNGLYFVSGYKGIFYCNASGVVYATGIGI